MPAQRNGPRTGFVYFKSSNATIQLMNASDTLVKEKNDDQRWIK